MKNPTYPSPAPVFAFDEIIGKARTSAGAMRIYTKYFAGTGSTPLKAVKTCPDLIDGWAPEFDEI